MWQTCSQKELEKMIELEELAMDPPTRLFWDLIKIPPVKWQLSPWGDEGGGFWVVALAGRNCVYFNDIEEGFNRSQYEEFGRIRDYWCNQSGLAECIRNTFKSSCTT